MTDALKPLQNLTDHIFEIEFIPFCWTLLFQSKIKHQITSSSGSVHTLSSLSSHGKTKKEPPPAFQQISFLRREMTINPVIAVVFFSVLSVAHGLGSMSTLAISYGSATVCGIVAGKSFQSIQCFQSGNYSIPIPPNVSFEGIAGGKDFLCGLRSGGRRLLCWDSPSNTTTIGFRPKRIYNGPARLTDLSMGEDQVCAIEVESKSARCWRGSDGNVTVILDRFLTISAGRGFTCGILATNKSVRCWGSQGGYIQNQFSNTTMLTLVAGDSHVCGVSESGDLICRGSNSTGQLLNVPKGIEFSGLALGISRSCGIKSSNRTVICWGGGVLPNMTGDIRFESIVASRGGDRDLFCGIISPNLSVICWGWGLNLNPPFTQGFVPLPKLIPGSCTQSSCSCGVYLDSENLCSGSSWFICEPCPSPPPPLSPPPSLPPLTTRTINKGLLAFAIVGSVGAFSGLCTIIYCIWTGICCCRQKKIHNSVQPTLAAAATATATATGPPSRSSSYSTIFRRQQSSAAMKMKRQRSGTSSSKHADRAEEFSLADLAAATDNFSPGNKIGAGSFGTVYRGKLADGREVAIKRGETGPKNKRFQEKESAFQSELAFLSRLHHKHLVSLVGFCEERDERLLVYEYMHNGALYDHIHGPQFPSSPLDAWKMRIKIALDASRGIEYLHNYAVPPIIHRDIKSSNILLDSNWTARVSDFGLSLHSPGSDDEDGSRSVNVNAAGTVGYMDPEYYGLHHLTVKSDVYGFGVVLLELLTGKRAVYKDAEGGPTSVIDYAVPRILGDELRTVLDQRVGPPELNESEAVELVAYTAVHCLHLEGKERPKMSDIVANLERALALCANSHSSVSNATLSIASD